MEQPESPSQLALLDAAEACLRRHGLGGLSTRRVAEAAGAPLSQIHYHFGSKQGLLLALLARQNAALLERQERMFASEMPLWQRWQQACDYLEADLRSGYVRVLQEMIAAGWHDAEIAAETRRMLRGWVALLERVAGEAAARFGGLGPFEPREVAALAGNLFMGAEATILLGFEETEMPTTTALRKLGAVIRLMETGSSEGASNEGETAGP